MLFERGLEPTSNRSGLKLRTKERHMKQAAKFLSVAAITMSLSFLGAIHWPMAVTVQEAGVLAVVDMVGISKTVGEWWIFRRNHSDGSSGGYHGDGFTGDYRSGSSVGGSHGLRVAMLVQVGLGVATTAALGVRGIITTVVGVVGIGIHGIGPTTITTMATTTRTIMMIILRRQGIIHQPQGPMLHQLQQSQKCNAMVKVRY